MRNYPKARLILEDNSVYEGNSFGFHAPCAGEVAFTTAMVGYPESITDPSYFGQILIFTYPLIGNYGIPAFEVNEDGIPLNFESGRIQVKAIIVSEHCIMHNHWNSNESLEDWLKKNEVPALSGIDTRALAVKIREKGAMLGKITADADIPFEDPNKKNLVGEVSIKEKVIYKRGRTRVLAVDCGIKGSILRCFLKRNITVIRVPWDYDFTKEEYDGLFISNGPGDPKQCKKTIHNLKAALKSDKPVFGICLGNQLLALAAGADTYKLKYGHRSLNQPCVKIGTKRCYITSQNHGFAVMEDTLPDDWQPWFRNVNDNTNEGIRHIIKPFFSVQFHPEANPGPADTAFLFDKFIKLINHEN